MSIFTINIIIWFILVKWRICEIRYKDKESTEWRILAIENEIQWVESIE